MQHPGGDREELSHREATSGASRYRSTQDRGWGFPPAAGTGRNGGPVEGKGAPDGRNARFVPGIVMRRTEGVLQRQADGEGLRMKVQTLLPDYGQDARFVSTIIIRRAGGVLQRGCARIYCVEA